VKGGEYTGYVSPENDALAKQIYERIKPEFEGYLEDIRSNKDGTRPRSSCGKYSTVRYWQAMAVAKIKESNSPPEVAALPKKVRKKVVPAISSSPPAAADSSDDDDASAAGKLTALMAKTSISGPPATPVRQGPRAQPQMETPVVPKSYQAVGGKQNPASTDEYYVNMAILVLLQQLLSDMRQLATEPPERRLRDLSRAHLDRSPHSHLSHCIQPFLATIEQIRRRRLERTQYRILKTLWQHLDFHSPDTLDDAALNDLGVVRGADLGVDNPSPLDFEPRFFAPCHGEISGLEEELETWGSHWHPSKDKPERLRDDEWIRNAGYTYAEMRLEWFDNVFLGLGMEYKGEIHPMYVASLPLLPQPSRLTPVSSNIYKGVNQEDMSFGSPTAVTTGGCT
jgi:hypothetical protein